MEKVEYFKNLNQIRQRETYTTFQYFDSEIINLCIERKISPTIKIRQLCLDLMHLALDKKFAYGSIRMSVSAQETLSQYKKDMK